MRNTASRYYTIDTGKEERKNHNIYIEPPKCDGLFGVQNGSGWGLKRGKGKERGSERDTRYSSSWRQLPPQNLAQ